MKAFLLLLLFCLPAVATQAQGTVAPALDLAALHPLAKQVFLPVFGLFLLCNFVLAAIRMVLGFLLKRQIVAAGVAESVVERLLPGPRDEQHKLVKWVALLLSTAAGLGLCSRLLPLGLHSVIVLLLSTAFGLLAYYLYLRRQPK